MKQFAKRSLSLLLALVMLCSLCVNAVAADEVKVNSTLSKTKLSTSSSAQTVTVTVAPETAIDIASYDAQLVVPDGWSITKIENNDANAVLTGGNYNLANGKVLWTSEDAENKTVGSLATFTVQIPAGTKAGSYDLKVTGVQAWKDYGQTAALTNGRHDSTLTLTLVDPNGYTAELSAWTTQCKKGGTLSLPVYITSGSDSVTTWNAASLKIKYDPSYVSFLQLHPVVGLKDAVVTDDSVNGILTISRYGDDVACGTNDQKAIVLVFDANKAGTTKIKLEKAYVDLQDNANIQNAPEVTAAGDLEITIAGASYTVTGGSDELDYASTANEGEDFEIATKDGYDARGLTVRYTVEGDANDHEAVRYDDKFIIDKQYITGNITLTVSYHSYTITKTGSGAADVTLPDKVFYYKNDYTFTLNKQENYAYTVKVTIGGEEVTCGISEDGTKYTIPGDKILGNAVVTVTRTKNASQINFSGSTVDVSGGASQTAPVGQDFTFTINRDPDYEYTVSAKYTESGETVPVVDNGDGTYTIKAQYINGEDITVSVVKAAPIDKFDLDVSEYVKVDGGKSVFLITAALKDGQSVTAGKVPAYDGAVMFRNEARYNGAYAYLVFSESDVDTLRAEVKNHITVVTGEAKTFNANHEVNYTDRTDINDAQLVYNIYNAKYDSFAETDMKMFLSADVNGDKKVNSLDASLIAEALR